MFKNLSKRGFGNIYGVGITLVFLLAVVGLIQNNQKSITGFEVASSTSTKPSVCQGYFGDFVCDDSAAECGSYYKQGVSLESCDECQTIHTNKDGDKTYGFDKCGAPAPTAKADAPTPAVTKLAGDINLDGCVDDIEVTAGLFDWATNKIKADYNKDGKVNEADQKILLDNYKLHDGKCRELFIPVVGTVSKTQELQPALSTCKERCGQYNAFTTCQCDTSCKKYNDCCTDMNLHCQDEWNAQK